VNHSLEVVAFCLLALVLCRSNGGWGLTLGIAHLLAATFTVESGLLVWVVLAAGLADLVRGESPLAASPS
jgi:hypothetical protein